MGRIVAVAAQTPPECANAQTASVQVIHKGDRGNMRSLAGPKRTAVVLLAVAALSGCAVPQQRGSVETPIYCKDKAQCDLIWQRAQVWVAQNSGYRLQTVTDSVIQTYGPCCAKVELAFMVTKSVNADGSAVVHLRAGCDNIFGCRPTLGEANQSFHRSVWDLPSRY